MKNKTHLIRSCLGVWTHHIGSCFVVCEPGVVVWCRLWPGLIVSLWAQQKGWHYQEVHYQRPVCSLEGSSFQQDLGCEAWDTQSLQAPCQFSMPKWLFHGQDGYLGQMEKGTCVWWVLFQQCSLILIQIWMLFYTPVDIETTAPPGGSGLFDTWLFEIVATETAESDKIAKTTSG